MDSLFRRYYIPKLVIREVRLSDAKTIDEVIDGQQRINTVQDFFNNDFKLPKSLGDLSKEEIEVALATSKVINDTECC